MLKKNSIFIISLILLLGISVILLFQNIKLKREFLLQKNKNISQSIKLQEYDSITFGLRSILSNFSNDNVESLSGFELTKKLAFSLNLTQNPKNFVKKDSSNFKINSNYTNSNFSNKTFLSLKNANDSVVSLFNKIINENDSLYYKLNITNELLNDAKKDTITLKNSKNVEIFYFGNLTNKIANGFGIGFYKEKGFYIGNWSMNLRNGLGKHNYTNGDVYFGDFLNDKREGFGVYYHETGDKYEGEWKNDLMNGKGIITLKNGTKKEGFWIDGKMKKK